MVFDGLLRLVWDCGLSLQYWHAAFWGVPGYTHMEQQSCWKYRCPQGAFSGTASATFGLAVLMFHTPVTLCGWASGVMKFKDTFFHRAALFSEDNYTCDSQHLSSSVTAEQCLRSEFKCSGNMSHNFRNAKLPQKSTVQDRCLALTSGELLYLW